MGGGGQRHMATWACGQGAIQSNEIAPGRERKNNDGGMVGGESGGETSGRKYYITLYTSARPWQQSNTLDLCSR